MKSPKTRRISTKECVSVKLSDIIAVFDEDVEIPIDPMFAMIVEQKLGRSFSIAIGAVKTPKENVNAEKIEMEVFIP